MVVRIEEDFFALFYRPFFFSKDLRMKQDSYFIYHAIESKIFHLYEINYIRVKLYTIFYKLTLNKN